MFGSSLEILPIRFLLRTRAEQDMADPSDGLGDREQKTADDCGHNVDGKDQSTIFDTIKH